jgi:hypothetical protein
MIWFKRKGNRERRREGKQNKLEVAVTKGLEKQK